MDEHKMPEPVAWVAADTLNSPHPTCISSLAYMSQLDRERGREYVPLYTAPVAAQKADDEAKGQIEALDLDNHRLRRAMQKVMARLTNLLDEDQFGNIESIVTEAGVEPPEAHKPDGGDAKDAERYRWLRDEAICFPYDVEIESAWCVFGFSGSDPRPIEGRELDEAIDAARRFAETDAAMAAQPQGEEVRRG